jgi:hypothetical protein
MDRFDSGVAGEIADVEGHNLADIMRLHHSYQTCVMDLNAAYAILNEQIFPGSIRCVAFVKNLEELFESEDLVPSFLNRESQAVVRLRPSSCVPEFGDVLDGDTKGSSRSIKVASARTAEAFIGCPGCTERSRMLVSMRIAI